MANLLFFSRVGILFNLCYLAALLYRLNILLPDSGMSPLVIIAGNVLALIVNLLLVTGYVICIIKKRNIKPVPLWLGVLNSLFLIIQLADLFL